MKRLFVFLLTVLAVAACSDGLDVAEQKMQEIAGDYLLTSLSDRHDSYLKQLPDTERESIQHARLAKSGSDGLWYFEYTLPVQVSGSKFTYHQIRQEIVWEPAFGEYFLSLLTENDLTAIGWETKDISVEMKPGKITFWYLDLNLACVWTKQ